MLSHNNFIEQNSDNRVKRLLMETVVSYVEAYVLPNMNFLMNHEDARNIKRILAIGADMTAEEFEDQLRELPQNPPELDKIKLIYVMLRRLITEPITEVDTLGIALANMGIHLTEKKSSRLNNTLRILIFNAIDEKTNALSPQLK